MCCRCALPDMKALTKALAHARNRCQEEFKPLFNVPPTAQVPIVKRAEDGGLDLLGARWGLIPGWWKQDQPPPATFNARSEDAADKPTWRDSLRSMRGLMPVRGWYEWNENMPVLDGSGKSVKQPFFIFCPEEPVIAFAALWSLWARPGTAPVLSCALLTKPAAPDIAFIHPRMPVVLKPDRYAAWLDPDTPPGEVQQLIANAREDLASHPVSTRVNSVRHDSPELMEKIQLHATGEFEFGDY